MTGYRIKVHSRSIPSTLHIFTLQLKVIKEVFGNKSTISGNKILFTWNDYLSCFQISQHTLAVRSRKLLCLFKLDAAYHSAQCTITINVFIAAAKPSSSSGCGIIPAAPNHFRQWSSIWCNDRDTTFALLQGAGRPNPSYLDIQKEAGSITIQNYRIFVLR